MSSGARLVRRSSRYRPAGGGGGGTNGFTNRFTFTIDHTQCGTADSTNFPVCVRETRNEYKSGANGGSVTDANGYDIVFCADAGLTTLLDFELVAWDGATGTIEAHVRVPTLSHTADTVFYGGVGKSSITTDQSNRTGVWDSNYGAVYHFGKTLGGAFNPADRTLDSTANANTLSNGAGGSTTVAGTVGVALDVSNSVQILGAANSASLQCTTAFTVEAWARAADFTVFRCLVSRATSSSRNYALYSDNATGHALLSVTQGGTFVSATGTTAISTTGYDYIVGTYDGSNLRVWRNGVNEGTTALTGAVDNPADTLLIGCLDYSLGASDPWLKYIDEVRVSSAARSSSYLTATYNNQKASSTFYTVT